MSETLTLTEQIDALLVRVDSTLRYTASVMDDRPGVDDKRTGADSGSTETVISGDSAVGDSGKISKYNSEIRDTAETEVNKIKSDAIVQDASAKISSEPVKQQRQFKNNINDEISDIDELLSEVMQEDARLQNSKYVADTRSVDVDTDSISDVGENSENHLAPTVEPDGVTGEEPYNSSGIDNTYNQDNRDSSGSEELSSESVIAEVEISNKKASEELDTVPDIESLDDMLAQAADLASEYDGEEDEFESLQKLPVDKNKMEAGNEFNINPGEKSGNDLGAKSSEKTAVADDLQVKDEDMVAEVTSAKAKTVSDGERDKSSTAVGTSEVKCEMPAVRADLNLKTANSSSGVQTAAGSGGIIRKFYEVVCVQSRKVSSIILSLFKRVWGNELVSQLPLKCLAKLNEPWKTLSPDIRTVVTLISLVSATMGLIAMTIALARIF